MDDRPLIGFGGIFGGGVLATILLCGALAGCPAYNVYTAQKAGEAELAQADQNRQIQVAQSKAKAEAAKFEADAEVTRATGVAQANKIIGDSLSGDEGARYLQYLWVNKLDDDKQRTVVYVPTEGGALPAFLEAGRTVQQK